MRPPLREMGKILRGQTLQDLFAQFLGFSEDFLIFDEDAVQFE